ncbi:hypothetical protein [Streptomyces marincola]|uniref:Uncharacterized protein n=1 Tax=Streptomyces marincola TaxID=2878388 RepID=A0A1W7CYC7_9ACTN|nr:hypothetical protein [Streptomyces marincola]ARQ69813.1 hypothetical protein CAG99_13905 [Streptomyces marincola]
MRMRGEALGGDIDWEGERRRIDSLWMTTALLLAEGAVLIAVAAFAFGPLPALIGAGVWVLITAVVMAVVRRTRRRVAADIGVSERYVGVVGRRIRRERVPDDPVARRAMGRLLERQRRQLSGRRWLWPVLAVLYGSLAVAHGLGGGWGAAVMWGLAAVLACAAPGMLRTQRARLDRVERRLRQAEAPAAAAAEEPEPEREGAWRPAGRVPTGRERTGHEQAGR